MAVYSELYHDGKLSELVEAARALLENCRLCPRRFGINRLATEKACAIPVNLRLFQAIGDPFP